MKSACSSGVARDAGSQTRSRARRGRGFAAGQTESFEIDQRCGGFEVEALGDEGVGAGVEGAHDAVLGEASGFDGGEEAVERAQWLGDLRRGRDAGLASSLGDDHAVGAELS